MRTALVILGICLVTVSAFAGNIDQQQATLVAENFIAFKASVNAWDGAATATIDLKRTLVENDEVIGYYFEVAPDGYLLVPAFRELPPVKAYAEQGRISFDHPESFGALLQGVLAGKAETLARFSTLDDMAADGIDIAEIAHNADLWDVFTTPDTQTFLTELTLNQLDDYTPGTAMLTSAWHQSEPYSNYCPVINNENCLVGCVATATAQVMNFWDWPPYGEGEHSYNWNNITLYADYSDEYDWANVLDNYNGTHTSEQSNAVAEVCYEVGVAFEMNYGINGSGAHTADAAWVLPTYFRYSESANVQYRSNYPDTNDWFMMLQEEMNHERPLIYRIEGHAIVSDGWRVEITTNYIHFNYGWGGSNNAWFALDAIPGSDDPNEQYAIREIYPLIQGEEPVQWDAPQLLVEDYVAASGVWSADLDGDGDQDMLASSYIEDSIVWLENLNGDATVWAEHTVVSAFNGARDVSAADVDGDGDMDVLGAAFVANDVTWWENDGSGGGWTEHMISADFFGAIFVRGQDMDDDGDTDVYATSFNDHEVVWWENEDGDGLSWDRHTVAESYGSPRGAYAADIDGDGDQDMVTASYGENEITWWNNINGNGFNWTRQTVETGADGAYAVYADDIDGDGDNDIVAALFGDDQIRWWANVDGTGSTWIAQTVDDSFDGATSVLAADVDADGDLDLVGTAMLADDVTWWENQPGILGIEWVRHRVESSFGGAQCVHVADLDVDGDLDLAAAAYDADQIMVWLQSGSPNGPGPIEIDLTPSAYGLEVPRGGMFSYDLLMTVNTAAPAFGYVWTTATLPNGQSYGPVFSVQFLFAPGLNIAVDGIQQEIPMFAPLGDYLWHFKAGPNLQNAVAWDSFPFTVVATGTDAAGANDWASNGATLLSAVTQGDERQIATDETLPREYALSSAYPNPFNATTRLSVSLPEASELSLTVYNIAGQQVVELAHGQREAGLHAFTWDASPFASGLYFVNATVPGKLNQVRKLMLVR
ncbi:C10 family peptidase [bacterium]|nr:C10 family peptidase [bacterium]